MGKETNKSSITIQRRRHRVSGKSPRPRIHRSSESGTDWAFQSDEDPEIEDSKLIGPSAIQLIMSSEKTLLLGLVAFRIVNSLMIQTWFVPDEYWQTLEVAHHSVFRYGFLTWEWRTGLRSYFYPLIFTTVYQVMAMFHLDHPALLIKVPRIIQAIFAAIGDLYLYKMSRRLADQSTAQLALCCQLASWFTFYCATRTMANSLEAVLTTVAMYYFPWPDTKRKSQWMFVFVVGLTIMVRTTAIITLLPMCAWHLWMQRKIPLKMLKLYGATGLFMFLISTLIDKNFYGKWVIVHWEFLKFNFLHNSGTFYGAHPWHWYLSQGIGTIMTTHLFPFIMGAWTMKEKAFLYIIAWTVFVYSMLGHKEFRFLLPLLPLAMHVCGQWLNKLYNHADTKFHFRANLVLFVIIVTNLPMALYFGLLHQRGTMDVMNHLQGVVHERQLKEPVDVLFLMPCHSTPYYSHIHKNISMQFLTCEPNLNNVKNYLDEADTFYVNPTQWLEKRFPENSTVPSHIVMFNCLVPKISNFIEKFSYHECARFFHAHVGIESRIGSHVVVQCR